VKGNGIRRYNRPERDFEMIHRSFMRLSTKALSPRGTKVALYVLSHDHGYVLTQEGIARKLEMAVRTVADALADLERAGLLVRIEERNARGHRTGTAMHVSDVPFTDQERADLLESLPAKSADAESAGAESAGPKKSNSKQESKQAGEQPSGGSDAAAPPAPEPDPSPEEDMPRAAALNQPGLFDAPVVDKPKRKDRPDPVGSPAVVAAFIESYSAHHDGKRPLGFAISRVGRDAKLILQREESTEAELVQAATRMGRGEWANLPQELSLTRRATTGRGTVHAPVPRTAEVWSDLQEFTRADLPELDEHEVGDFFGVNA
jgi:hypothetical protein